MSFPDAQHDSPVADARIIRALWPVLLAAVIGLFPFTVYSTFLVPIAGSADQDASTVGMLRGLGGVAALVVGVALAPLIARWSAPYAAATSLAFLAVTSLVATLGSLPAFVIFCIGIGAATAILTPTLLTMATTMFSRRGDSGRAATMVTATQSLAAVLAAPVIGAIGSCGGWRGTLWVTAGLAGVTATLFLRADRNEEVRDTARLGYKDAFGLLRRRGDLLALIGIAFLRTTAFMGYLAFLAQHYHDRFELDPVAFTLVWTLSGASFFTGNYLAGRWARRAGTRRHLLYGGLGGGAVALVVVFTADALPVALAATALMGFSHAIVAALITTLIAECGGEVTTAAYSINGAGMSLGVFVGAVLAGAGLALGAGLGLAIALLVPAVVALALIPAALGSRSAIGSGSRSRQEAS
ncbi:MFS transporter [Microbacterium sp. CIAB417]|uniref:MFS transporter n=1 Tax=Microbacterium sp. CIAB417 TaxID=2860287 RepID=UPI001FAD67D6|nr:MFS transporter [Microbacterium sp. CIAB417]